MPIPKEIPDITIAQAAVVGKCSQDKIRDMIARGDLIAYRFGRAVRIKSSDLLKAFEQIEVA